MSTATERAASSANELRGILDEFNQLNERRDRLHSQQRDETLRLAVEVARLTAENKRLVELNASLTRNHTAMCARMEELRRRYGAESD